MTFDVEFEEQDCTFEADFGEIQSADAGGYEKGYEMGYSTGHQKGYTEGENAGYNKGYTDGQESVPNLFEYATNISNTYYGARFPANAEMALTIPAATNINFMFYNALGLVKATLKGISDNRLMECQQVFRESTQLATIDLTNCIIKPRNAYQMFFKCSALKDIKGELDFSECTNVNNTFLQCSLLEEVRLKAYTLSLSISFAQSSKLSTTSIQSIIDGLATVETAQTLTLHKLIDLTDEQKVTIYDKGWTLVQ